MSETCYRCQGPVESRDNIRDWGFLGSWLTSETETTSTRRIRVQMTTVRYTDYGPQPTRCDDRISLCRSCWGAVMKFVGVGVRPENRMALDGRESREAGA